MAPSTADVVRSAGGWLCDHAMAGWDVHALIGDDADSRPLRILGVHSERADVAGVAAAPGPRPHMLAVQTEVYDNSACVRRMVREYLIEGLTEVQFWDETITDEDPDTVSHRMSLAARSFKTHALAASAQQGVRVMNGRTEMFRRGEQALQRSPLLGAGA